MQARCADRLIFSDDPQIEQEAAALKLLPRPRGNPRTKQRRVYLDCVSAFDIETSIIDGIYDADGNERPQGVMFVWQFQLGTSCTIMGRTWDEFRVFIDTIASRIPQGVKLVCYIHNLSYEFQFLAGVHFFEPPDVFAIEKRRVLRADYGPLELRCSYIHSNDSLERFAKKLGAAHQKQNGDDFDYTKTRYPWTPLSVSEVGYCTSDVRAVVESVMNEMAHDGDSLYTIPATSTGYVRRDVKRAIHSTLKPSYIRDQMPSFEVYLMLREAFRGGNTHANRFYAGKLLSGVKSTDMSSAYPAAQCQCKFPVGEFRVAESCTPTQLSNLMQRGKAIVFRAAFWDVTLRYDWWGFPYIPISKCRGLCRGQYDNGRVLSAEYLEITLTDIDFKIMLDEYNFSEFQILTLAYTNYGTLPPAITDTDFHYFERKTALKGVDGAELDYVKSKNKLNAIYGMSAQDPVKQDISFEDGEFLEATDDPALLLEIANKRMVMPYQWGVWTTAHVRARLETALKAAGDGAIYCDTDSVKYIGECDVSAFNRECVRLSTERSYVAYDAHGGAHYMGVFEDERPYAEFKTLGAKKYVTRYDGEGIKTTIAGVNKSKGGAELESKGGFDAFKPGFVFRDAGGVNVYYNDDPPVREVIRDGRRLEITRNTAILPGTYEVGVTAEYAALTGIKRIK